MQKYMHSQLYKKGHGRNQNALLQSVEHKTSLQNAPFSYVPVLPTVSQFALPTVTVCVANCSTDSVTDGVTGGAYPL